MNELERDEARLTRILGAVRAPADPAVLARARARLAASPDVPRVFRWLGTPAALAGACALLLISAGASFAVLGTESAASSRDTQLVSALIGDDGTYGLPTATGTVTTDGGTQDSGKVTP
jgi:hypothetical protein